ncbi:MAG TPA: amino acid carrier protein [Candidatus Limnocylindria bacterium]|nr:amino acid carrier protein [Candidatus Limnocylindria bacterium]
MQYAQFMQLLNDWFLGWPLIIFAITVGIACTIACNFVQIRYFLTAWKELVASLTSQGPKGDVTPLQAFINTLSANLGNGSLAGMAVAIHAGGPGAAFWVVVIGLLMMSVRFAEVYLSIHVGARANIKSGLGGPMLYLKDVVGGKALAWLYAVCCLLFGLSLGNGIQANTIGLSLQTILGVPTIVTAVLLGAFIWYIVTGGSQRISKASEAIVPIKVGVFFVASIIVLGYHYAAIIPALQLIFASAFKTTALTGGILGFSVQQAMRFGMATGFMANESGLGTAAILFSSTGSKTPVKDALMSMISTFISITVCFMISLCIIASGVDAWSSETMTSSALTIAAYSTVFGKLGGWIVTFLSITFGVGVAVSFAYISREAWLFVTGGRGSILAFNILYTAFAFVFPLLSVSLVWGFAEIMNACLLVINLLGIAYLLPVVRKGLQNFKG